MRIPAAFRLARTHAAVALLAAAVACTVHAAPKADAKPARADADVARLTDLQVRMMPFGAIFDVLAKDDAHWPMQENPDAVTPAQLACLRGELSTPGFRRYKQAEVQAYVAANRPRVKAEIALLEQGAAEVFGKLVLAGAESERTGVEVTPESLLASATPDQMASFITLFGDPNYAALRTLSGLGDAISTGKSAEENESAGQQLGSAITVKIMLKAMSTCGVPTSALLQK